MLKSVFTTVFVLLFVTGFSQTDKNGNPIVNSITTGQDTVGDMQLIANYYTLKNNIDNKHTAAFIAKRPTLDDIITAATTLPSDFFILTKNAVVLNLIMVRPSGSILAVDPSSKKSTEYSNTFNGIITQNRANEIIVNKYDANASIKDSVLFFNNQRLNIITNQQIKSAVLRVINDHHLGKIVTPQALSKDELKRFILDETKEGGKLDFFTAIKGKEYDGILIKPELFSTMLGAALYSWGKACAELGVQTEEDALSIFEEFRQRKLNQRETEYIKLGFEKKLEK